MPQVAVCQVALDVENAAGTWRAVVDAVEQAAEAGAELVVLPELTSTGSSFADAEEAAARAEPLTGPTVEGLATLSDRHGIVLVAGFCEVSGLERPYNSAVLLDRGALAGHYRKTHLWDSEKLLFCAGPEPPRVHSTSLGRVGVVVCYDLEFPEVTRRLAAERAQIVAAPANWPLLPKPVGERPIEIAKAQAAAAQNKIFVAIADRVGSDRGSSWTGGSVICDVSGYLVAEAATGKPDVVWADLDFTAADDKTLGPHNDAFGDLRPELYQYQSKE